jgi:hypothetical protein
MARRVRVARRIGVARRVRMSGCRVSLTRRRRVTGAGISMARRIRMACRIAVACRSGVTRRAVRRRRRVGLRRAMRRRRGMRRRTGPRCARMRSGRATRLMLTPRQRGDPEHQQSHQPVLQHLFTYRSAIHYCLLIVQLLNANPNPNIICRTVVRRRLWESLCTANTKPADSTHAVEINS